MYYNTAVHIIAIIIIIVIHYTFRVICATSSDIIFSIPQEVDFSYVDPKLVTETVELCQLGTTIKKLLQTINITGTADQFDCNEPRSSLLLV